MAEKYAEFSHDQLDPYMGINSEDLEKQCSEESDVMQSVEYQSQPSSSYVVCPYD